MEELRKAFNKGLLDNQTETSDESSDSDDDDNNDADVQLCASPDDSSTYFTSREWQIKLASITNAYHSVKQPNEPKDPTSPPTSLSLSSQYKTSPLISQWWNSKAA